MTSVVFKSFLYAAVVYIPGFISVFGCLEAQKDAWLYFSMGGGMKKFHLAVQANLLPVARHVCPQKIESLPLSTAKNCWFESLHYLNLTIEAFLSQFIYRFHLTRPI